VERQKTVNVYRIHLKTDAKQRKKLVEYCLFGDTGRLAIGWSYLHEIYPEIRTAADFSDAYRRKEGSVKRPLETFAKVEKNDLLWTRDLDGNYYICRVVGSPYAFYDKDLDIGAVVPVDVRKVGINVPGNIVSRFSRSGNSPTIERIRDDSIIRYSMSIYNELCGAEIYSTPEDAAYDLFDMLPPLDLEELVIDYLQIRYDYYLSKNSVARADTTIKIECELFPRTPGSNLPAVLQVKGGDGRVPSDDFQGYVQDGKHVYLFFSNEQYDAPCEGITYISRAEILKFAHDYYEVLPSAIQRWIAMCR